MTVTFFTDSFKSKIAGRYKGHFANELYPSCLAVPGEREYQRHVFDGVSHRNYSFEQCHCRDKLAGREEAEVAQVTLGQLDPPRVSARPFSRRGQCRAGTARLGAGRGCSGTSQSPFPMPLQCSDNCALSKGTVRRESTGFIKARAGWCLSEAQAWAGCTDSWGGSGEGELGV